ncbi:hypothetical protein GCM10009796_00670 [Microbacterium koreense]
MVRDFDPGTVTTACRSPSEMGALQRPLVRVAELREYPSAVIGFYPTDRLSTRREDASTVLVGITEEMW